MSTPISENPVTVRKTDTIKSFWNRVWREAEPIVAHGVVVLFLDASLLLIGLVTLGLEKIFSKQQAYFTIIEKVEIWLALALLCLFGAYTLLGVGIRLVKELISDARTSRGGS